jgi:diguanylate cyclase (GGDEF)-like protein
LPLATFITLTARWRAQLRRRVDAILLKMNRLVLAVLLLTVTLLWIPLTVWSGTIQGTPLLRRYLADDYKVTPQHWAIATDGDGRLFVGNGEGVLRYDGDQWDLINLPGRQIGRALASGKDGKIYVGSYDTFGWLRPGSDGVPVYQELLTVVGLKGHARDVGNVWQVIPNDEGVYFRTDKTLYFLRYDQREVKHWQLGESQRGISAQGSVLFARVDGLGFCRFVNGHFVLEPGGEQFSRQSLAGVITRPGWRLLIGDEGFYRADALGIRALPGDAGSQTRGKHPYAVASLADGSFVVGTQSGEVFHYGSDFQLRGQIKLGTFGVSALGSDHEGGLWVATEGDLVRMSLPSPWSFIGPADGLNGSAYDFEWYDGALWLATTHGIVRMQPMPDGKIDTKPMPWVDLEGFALVGTDSGLLIGHRKGLMVLDPGASSPRPLLQSDSEGVVELLASRFDPDRVYALGDEHLSVIRRENGHWQLGMSIPLGDSSAATLLETADGELWFGDSRGGPQRWTLDHSKHALLHKDVFGPLQGLALNPSFGSSVFELDGQVHVVSGTRGFRFNGSRFVADTSPPFTLVERPDELVVEATPLGTYAFTRRQMLFRAAGQPAWHRLHIGSRMAAGYSRLRYNHDGKLRVATWTGLLQLDPAETQPPPVPLVLRFDRVTATSPDGHDVRHLAPDDANAKADIPAGYRLHFRFGIVSMDSPPEFRYQLRGPGIPDEWSNWTDRELTVQANTSGDFVLTVEARTASGRNVAPIHYAYTILPRWYDRWWVELIAMLLAVSAVAIGVREFIRRRTHRYAETTRQLEIRIAERTYELEEANRQLGELATEDALTGIPNRRALELGLQREWVRCQDQHRPLSVLMIDVDHFKHYNDTHGHLEGDVMLREIARNLHALHDPERELLARFGGEEFALLLPGVSQADALRRAEELRSAVQERIGGTTISIGVAGFVPSGQRDSADLLGRADAALYRAKRAGRNRVEGDMDFPAESAAPLQ